MQVIRHPKNVDSDAKLLDLIDTLLELQANKKSYKESAVLGNHLLGRDWHYEGSNWIELNTKIQYVYDFREKHKGNPKLEFLLQILEKWHMLKGLLPQLKDLSTSVQELQQSIRKISKDMDLETPLESLSLEKWLNKIKSWSENWSRLDIHLQLPRACFFHPKSGQCWSRYRRRHLPLLGRRPNSGGHQVQPDAILDASQDSFAKEQGLP